MLITKLKDENEIRHLAQGKVFAICCHGCKEISFPEAEAEALIATLDLTGRITTDYICQPENLAARLEPYWNDIQAADAVLVFSCGVGVQTVADYLEGKRVYACCDTVPLPGFQGVTPLEHDCAQCGQCYLNLTGGICPITACSKSLVNGQCGGAKDGKCEVDPTMDCGWERICRRLQQLGRSQEMNFPVQIRNWAINENV